MKMKTMMKRFAFVQILIMTGLLSLAQSVSVSPSRLYYKVNLGDYKAQEVTVTNNSKSTQSFQISFADFESKGKKGKTTVMKSGESDHSCSNWLSASPAFFELGPGKSQKVQVLMQVPNTPDANKVTWAIMSVKLARENKGSGEGDEKTVGFGIVQTFQFVVHVFQTPPSVSYKNAEIMNFQEVTKEEDDVRTLSLDVKNSGDAIIDCASYLELTNLSTGETQRLAIKAYTVLPGGEREVIFQLPVDLKSGEYSILGVVDYGSKEKIEAAEMDIKIP